MEPVEEAKEKASPIDRVTLGTLESERVEAWLAQVSEFSKGYLSLSKSDLVNFLLRKHVIALSHKELAEIRSDHYDPVRHITWIAPQIRQALKAGDVERVQALQDELRRVELSAVRPRAQARKRPCAALESRKKRRKETPESSGENAGKIQETEQKISTRDES